MEDTYIYFIRLRHPYLNQINYKICIEIQQRVCFRKIHNVNGRYYGVSGMALSNASLMTQQTSDVDISECVFM